MNTTHETFNMVADSTGQLTPNKVTLHKALHQDVHISVADDATVIHCQFCIYRDEKFEFLGGTFIIDKDNSKTYDASDYSDDTYYLLTHTSPAELAKIKPEQLQLVDGQLVGVGSGGSGEIDVED